MSSPPTAGASAVAAARRPACGPGERRGRPGPRLGVALLAAAAVVACDPAPEEELFLAAYVPVSRPLVSTRQVVPPTEHDHATLGLGWPGSLLADAAPDGDGGATDPRDGTWRIRGRVASFTFQRARPGDTALETEIRAQGDRDDPEQTLELRVNGRLVAHRSLAPRWSLQRFELPARTLRVGVNEARLEFRTARRPEGAPPGALPVPARVRWLRLVFGEERPPWPAAAPAVRVLAGDGDGAAAAPGIAMRTDSLLELAVPTPAPARIRGSVDVDRARGSRRGRIHASVEIGAAGSTREILRQSFEAGDAGPRPIDVALPPSRDGRALLRLRVWGSANGVVSWRGLRLAHGGPPQPDPLGEPDAELQSAPAGGDLVDAAPDAPRGGLPDVVVVLLDAARADAFGPYGGPSPTPAAASLARQGTRVLRAIAPAPWTEPSVPSLLTGLYPDVHGVEVWNWPLPQEIVTLPELLADAGYRTVLFSHHLLWRGNRSLLQGFEVVETVGQEERQELPEPSLLLDEERPTFALVHLLLPHAPYDAPPPFRGRHAVGPERDVSPRALGAFRGRFGERRPSPELVAHARGRYAEMVDWADERVGTLLEGLRRRDRYEDAWVILTSDHGEGFHEHGEFLHSRFLYDEVLRVPLILKWPAGVTGLHPELPGPVSLVDLAPTILDGLGVGSGEVRFQGRSLLPALRGRRHGGPRAAYAVTRVTELSSQPPLPQLALERDGLKVILDEPTGELELYDLRSDPGETDNLVDARPVAAAELLQALLAHRRRHVLLHGRYETAETAFEIDEEMLEGLRALGYIE